MSTVLALAPSLPGCAGFQAVINARLAAFELSLRPTGPNRTVDSCREAMLVQAVKLGALEIEAVSAGPDHLNDKGQFVGPVRVWITYVRPSGYEVREATLMCIVDPEGKFIDAFDPAERARFSYASYAMAPL